MDIERATVSDIPALCDLLSSLFAQEAEFAPNPAAQSRALALILANPHLGTVLVATEGGQVVAMVTLLFTVSTALGERVAWLEDMVVSPARRGAGIGTVLLKEAIRVCAAEGCKRITLLTDRTNQAAQDFYAEQGFEASHMLPMRLFVGQERDG